MTNKQIAKAFLTEVIEGRIEEAYEKYVNMSGRHHNAYFASGMETLKQAMIENEKQFPNKQFEILHIAAEGDLVMVHSKLSLGSESFGMGTLHVLKFKDGKIIEMWDMSQAVPNDMPNSDGMF
jgi:predicted SnoaL-like aldol condensation-catalyzing enzyme